MDKIWDLVAVTFIVVSVFVAWHSSSLAQFADSRLNRHS
jgi:hypothetical protein